jgi:hypothetical protein
MENLESPCESLSPADLSRYPVLRCSQAVQMPEPFQRSH